MTRQMQALLRSGLIFPGAGQLFLGRRRRALAFALATLAAFVWLMAAVLPALVASAQGMVPDLLAGRPPSVAVLLGQSQQILLDAASAAALPFWTLIGVWISNIIDVWLLAR